MTTTFDLRLATLSAAYTAGDTTPRQLIIALRDKAADSTLSSTHSST